MVFCFLCGTILSGSNYCKKCQKTIPTNLYSIEPKPYSPTRYEAGIQRVMTRAEPFKHMSHDIIRLTSTATKKPDTANLSFKSELDDDVENIIVSFIPDSVFRTKGNIEVNVNNNPHMTVNPPNLTDVASFDMHVADVHDTLMKGQKIEIRIWNSVDAALIAITVGLTTGQYLQ